MAVSLIRMHFDRMLDARCKVKLIWKTTYSSHCSYQSGRYRIGRSVCKLRRFFHKLFIKHEYAALASPWKPFFAFRSLFLDHFSLQLQLIVCIMRKKSPKTNVFLQSRPYCGFPFTVTTTKKVPNRRKNERNKWIEHEKSSKKKSITIGSTKDKGINNTILFTRWTLF